MTAPFKLVTPPTVEENNRREVVRILKQTLDLAESGEVDSVTVIVNLVGDKWAHESSGTQYFPKTIGYLEIVKQRLMIAYHSQWNGE